MPRCWLSEWAGQARIHDFANTLPGSGLSICPPTQSGKRKVYGFHSLVNGPLDVRKPARVHVMGEAGYGFAEYGADLSDPKIVDKEA